MVTHASFLSSNSYADIFKTHITITTYMYIYVPHSLTYKIVSLGDILSGLFHLSPIKIVFFYPHLILFGMHTENINNLIPNN